ncbi:hypothetical protein SAMN05216354_0609 [Xylanibacter ruminicola]|uniref:Uncharacterized protein n=1 Tax=Xylanibacter ruminicola TaxID=839 RepID=A0A1H5SDQ6_XYLRU|nr:hypothetical protein [Xylanibacter ruminicola]SEF47981.1 hypothetical protein SAMN05216354_0609 [Xylanibacter ruminicola]
MDLSEILNLILGGSLMTAIIAIVTIRSAMKKARGEAERALAEADTVNLTNTEQATRILMQNIVKPLKEELDATRRDLNATKREISRFRKAVEAIPLCPYHAGCPVLGELQDDTTVSHPGKSGQSQGLVGDHHQADKRRRAPTPGASVGAIHHVGADRLPAIGCGVQHRDRSGESLVEETAGREPDAERPGYSAGEGDYRHEDGS